jgi:predicted HAD superfamily hydrolase
VSGKVGGKILKKNNSCTPINFANEVMQSNEKKLKKNLGPLFSLLLLDEKFN